MKKLSQSISDKEVVLPVRRDHVLDDALLSVKRKSFPHSYFLKVQVLACTFTFLLIFEYLLRLLSLGRLLRMVEGLEGNFGAYFQRKLKIPFLKVWTIAVY